MTVEPKEKIEISTILTQVENSDVYFEYVWPWHYEDFRNSGDMSNPAHILMFRMKESYECNANYGWYYMRVWITQDNRNGYLIDTRCPFTLVKDIPLQMLWEALQEIFVMAKLVNNTNIIGNRKPIFTLGEYPEHYEDTINGQFFFRDSRFLRQGYYKKQMDDPPYTHQIAIRGRTIISEFEERLMI